MKTVLIYSGGLDSTVLLYELRNQKRDLLTISFDYGQRHVRELEAAAGFTTRLGVPHKIMDLSDLKGILSSALTGGGRIPEGHYADESMKQTVVPNRNMIMLSAAAGYAMTVKADTVAYGVHAGDFAIYPDCRPEFADAFDKLLALADWHRVNLERPFIHKTKADIVKQGFLLNVPFQEVWSCYKGQRFHCGVCGACVERKEAFGLAHVTDPTIYADQMSSQRQ